MKSITPEKIELTQDQKNKQAQDIIAKHKAQAVNVSDEQSKAERFNYSKIEFIKAQSEYSSSFAMLALRKSEMDAYSMQLTGEVSLTWNGFPMPKDMVQAHYHITKINYNQLVSSYNSLSDQLTNIGLTKEQLMKVRIGERIYKELPKQDETPKSN